MVEVQDVLAVEVLLDELDWGESETIVLAREINADLVLMDEKKGRRKLSQLGMPKIGTLGILLKANQLGYVDDLEKEIDELRQKGFSISQFVVDTVLVEAKKYHP